MDETLFFFFPMDSVPPFWRCRFALFSISQCGVVNSGNPDGAFMEKSERGSMDVAGDVPVWVGIRSGGGLRSHDCFGAISRIYSAPGIRSSRQSRVPRGLLLSRA